MNSLAWDVFCGASVLTSTQFWYYLCLYLVHLCSSTKLVLIGSLLELLALKVDRMVWLCLPFFSSFCFGLGASSAATDLQLLSPIYLAKVVDLCWTHLLWTTFMNALCFNRFHFLFNHAEREDDIHLTVQAFCDLSSCLLIGCGLNIPFPPLIPFPHSHCWEDLLKLSLIWRTLHCFFIHLPIVGLSSLCVKCSLSKEQRKILAAGMSMLVELTLSALFIHGILLHTPRSLWQIWPIFF